MANIPSVAKRARQAERRRARNAPVRASLKTYQRKLREAIARGDSAGSSEIYREFTSRLDKAVKRGVIHKNKANRHKASFAQALAKAAKPVPGAASAAG